MLVKEYESSVSNLPENALELIEFLNNKINSIPKDYRKSAKVLFEIEDDYDGCVNNVITITYTRPNTIYEQATINRKEALVKKRTAEREMELLRALNEKYAGKS